MDFERMYSKIAGCLMAGALGDALGYEIEFESWNTIRNRFGPAGIQDLYTADGEACISDDTQMTLFTNEGMVLGSRLPKAEGCRETVAYYVYQAYLCWLATQEFYGRTVHSLWEKESVLLKEPKMNVRRAPGNTCLSALQSGDMGTVENPPNHSKGCGGVMRTAPLGFTGTWGDPLRTGAACAAITHGHTGGWMPAGILSYMIFRILYEPETSIERVADAALEHAIDIWGGKYPDIFRQVKMIRNAIRLSHTDLPEAEAIHSIGGGWVGDEALAIAIYSCCRHPDDLKDCLICAVNHSGDSDSTGAIAGNILGAYLGYEAVPADWIEKLEMTDVILDQARKMTETIKDSAG